MIGDPTTPPTPAADPYEAIKPPPTATAIPALAPTTPSTALTISPTPPIKLRTKPTRKRKEPSEVPKIPSQETICSILDEISQKALQKMYGSQFDDVLIKSSIHKKQLRKTTPSNSTYFGVVKNKDRFSVSKLAG